MFLKESCYSPYDLSQAGEEKAYHDFAVSNGRSLLYSYSISSASSYASVSPIQSNTYKRIEVGDTIDVASWFTTLGGTPSNIRVIDTRIATVSGTTLTAINWGKTQIICDNGNFRVIALEVRPKGMFAMPMVVAGGTVTVALKANGTVWAWGAGDYGQLGQGYDSKGNAITTAYRYPVPVMAGASGSGIYMENIIQVSAGQRHGLALRYDGAVFGWGRQHQGRLANGTTKDGKIALPIYITSSMVHVHADFAASFFINTNGRIYACGNNNTGNLGVGGTSDRDWLDYLVIGNAIIDVQAGWHGGMAVDYCGQVWQWGSRLGDKTLTDDQGTYDKTTESRRCYTPIKVPSNLMSRVVEVETIGGAPARFVLNADGNVYRWGYGKTIYGGVGSKGNNNQIVQMSISGIIHISGTGGGSEDGYDANKAMAAQARDGTIYTWGAGSDGQLGDGSWSNSSSPYRSHASTQTMQFEGAASDFPNYAAVNKDSSVWAWGRNNHGQLGFGSTGDRNVPVRVGGDYEISYIMRVKAAVINNSVTGATAASYTEADPIPTTITLYFVHKMNIIYLHSSLLTNRKKRATIKKNKGQGKSKSKRRRYRGNQ